MFVFSLFLVSTTFGEGKKFTINGKIPEMPSGRMIVITQLVDRVDTLGQGDIHGGKFVVEGEMNEPCVALIYVEGYGGGFVFILDSDAPYEMELFQSGKSVIEGGRLQRELIAYQGIVAEENEKIKAVRTKLEEARNAKHYRTASELQKKLEQAMAEAQTRLGKVVERNKDNVFAAYIQTAGMERMDLNRFKECYESLSDKAKMTGPGRLVAARIQALEGVDVNAVAPNFTLQTPEGKDVSLYDVKGKLKIIDFWASWCAPCRALTPQLIKLYEEFHSQGFEIVGISMDENKDVWVKAIGEEKMSWIQGSKLDGFKPGNPLYQLYNITNGIPFLVLVDENNQILATSNQVEPLRKLVVKVLKK